MNSPTTAPPPPDPVAEDSAQTHKAPPVPARLAEAEEIARHLGVAEKNFHLYPSYSKVVKHGVEGLHASLVKFHNSQDEPLHYKITQEAILFEEHEVYREEHRSKSLAFRLHKDGVRGVLFHPDLTEDEIAKLLLCFKQAADTDKEDDDFTTLFWEKDCENIQLQLVDDTEAADDEVVPGHNQDHLASVRFYRDRFKIPETEEQRLREVLEERGGAHSQGSREFELTKEEIGEIQAMVAEEDRYFAIFDFVDVLIEMIVTESSSKSFKEALSLIRNILRGLVENLEFDHAAEVLSKLSKEAHPALTAVHLKEIRDLVDGFCDEDLVNLLRGYLKESGSLANGHNIFRFMKSLGSGAVPYICEFLNDHQHLEALTDVLSHVGKKSGSIFCKHLEKNDPVVVRIMMELLLETQDESFAMGHICKVLRHPAEDVQKQAARTLHERGYAKAAPYFVPFLSGSSSAMRRSALSFFAKHHHPEAYDGVQGSLQGKAFASLDESDRGLAFKALVKCNREKGIRFIRSLFRFRFCFTQKAVKLRSAALLALVRVDEMEAERIANRYAHSKHRLATPAKQALAILKRMAADKARAHLQKKEGKGSEVKKKDAQSGKGKKDV